MQVREATGSDGAAIRRINARSLGYSDYPEDKAQHDFEYLLASSFYRIFVAEIDGKVVGYVNGSDYCTAYMPPMKNLMALAVLPECQGKGCGAALLAKAEEWAKEDGCQGVRLVSGYNRTGAHAFYESQGYTMRKEQKNYIKMF